MNDNVLWRPIHPQQSRMWQFMHFVAEQYQQKFTCYQQLYDWSIQFPEQFWLTLTEYFNITFNSPPQSILNNYEHMIQARWFVGATLNFAEKLLQRRDDHIALISINEAGIRQVITYKELYKQVAACAAGLRKTGVTIGDRVAGILPNMAHTVIAMLATVSLGAIWSGCSPDFGVATIIDRLGQIRPKVLFICDGYTYSGKEYTNYTQLSAIYAAITSVVKIVICPLISDPATIKNQNNIAYIPYCMWEEFLIPSIDCIFTILPFAHPIYILFTSGTTGKPKCIVHGAGGVLLQHIKELGLHADLQATDNLFCYTTCSWMMWNWMVSSLTLGATLTLYDGNPCYPDSSRLFQLIDSEKVSIFVTSARFLSNIEKDTVRPALKFSLSSLRSILTTGSPLLPKNFDFVYNYVKPSIQLCSISGGTDLVSCFALGNPLLPVYKGELQCLGLGMAVEIFNEQGKSIRQQRGELVCTKPFPSMPVCFWNDPDNKLYNHTYFTRFPNVWTHGDFAEITEHNGLIIYGRSDAILNPGGVRIGTAEIYYQIEHIPEILESVVVGQNWHDDVRIVLFVKLRPGITLTEKIRNQIRHAIREHASPRHVPRKILQVPDVPKTVNGKIVEMAVKQVVNGEEVKNINALANPESLKFFKNCPELSE